MSITKSFNTLKSVTIDGNACPQWLMVLPRQIPVGISNSSEKISEHEDYFPYFGRVFNDQTIS